ncbi:Acyl-CoA thioester hydrolase YbgC [Aquicella siphonis]|uniref:Acyl-CoA thioester hydrolase YbgC n=1 Tax=Aquicella siphonis TaxID=254247 RepID=A0A5E4PG25_9COXI|nr:YbgC/FadM family acyl-CoA thioesterase [Aquicella siphonis]VVC75296.1 Acyl-CoA thioester hydrolase YbgC [Aquicella siphonis]
MKLSRNRADSWLLEAGWARAGQVAEQDNRVVMMNEHFYPLRVHFEDTDCTGVVYHANYLKFMERARSEWIDSLGIGADWRESAGVHFLVHSLRIQFMQPARLHDRIEVVSRILSVRAASIIFDQCLRLDSMPDKILCRAEIKIACVDKDMLPRAIPEAPILESIRRSLS